MSDDDVDDDEDEVREQLNSILLLNVCVYVRIIGGVFQSLSFPVSTYLPIGSWVHCWLECNLYVFMCCVTDYSVSDETGSMEISLVSEGKLDRGSLDPKDVFLADTGKELFVWVGSSASPDEKKNAMPYAHVRYYMVWSIVHCQLMSQL